MAWPVGEQGHSPHLMEMLLQVRALVDSRPGQGGTVRRAVQGIWQEQGAAHPSADEDPERQVFVRWRPAHALLRFSVWIWTHVHT